MVFESVRIFSCTPLEEREAEHGRSRGMHTVSVVCIFSMHYLLVEVPLYVFKRDEAVSAALMRIKWIKILLQVDTR